MAIVPKADRPTHATYGRAESGPPRAVDGVQFWPFRVGVNRYTRISTDFRFEVWNNPGGGTYRARRDGVWVAKTFRKFDTAARAAMKELPDAVL